MSDGWGQYRTRRFLAYQGVLEWSWPAKALVAAGFAGFIALLAHLSVPLPWTPVPFSFQVLAVTVTGAYLGRNYGLLSVALYLLAGTFGLEVFADQESSGVDVLTGHTAGYLFGFAGAAWLVGWYVERRRARLLDRRSALILGTALAVLVCAGLATLVWVAVHPARFESSWSSAYGTTVRAGEYLAWVAGGLLVASGLSCVAIVRQAQGRGWEKFNLFLVIMAATLFIHVCGVPVLKASLDYSWPQAIALGSLVFLPFDLVKAALAVALTTPFLPSREDEMRLGATPHA